MGGRTAATPPALNHICTVRKRAKILERKELGTKDACDRDLHVKIVLGELRLHVGHADPPLERRAPGCRGDLAYRPALRVREDAATGVAALGQPMLS